MITLDYDRVKLERRNPRLRDERREDERLEAETACHTRGKAYVSRSRRRFRAVINPEPTRDGKYLKGGATQLVLALCDLHERPARAPHRVTRERALEAIEKRGVDALEELGSPVGKRSVSACLTYLSMGGEVLGTELRGLTPNEAAHVRSVSLRRAATREVTWPSQSTAPIMRVEHGSE